MSSQPLIYPSTHQLQRLHLQILNIIILTSAGSADGLGQAHNLDIIADLDRSLLDGASGHGASAGDREGVLDGHDEGLVDLSLGGGDGLLDLQIDR